MMCNGLVSLTFAGELLDLVADGGRDGSGVLVAQRQLVHHLRRDTHRCVRAQVEVELHRLRRACTRRARYMWRQVRDGKTIGSQDVQTRRVGINVPQLKVKIYPQRMFWQQA